MTGMNIDQKGGETGTGFSFNDYTGQALYSTLHEAIDTFDNKPFWKKIQRNGMKKDYSWENTAKSYVDLYNKAKAKIIN